jgi:DNA replication protein DnaC
MGDSLEGIRAERRAVGPLDGTTIPTEPDCADCRDRGWYTLDVPVGDPRFGKTVRCECQPAISPDRLMAFTELTPGMRRLTFDALGPPRVRDQTDVAKWNTVLAHTKAYARGQASVPWLVFAGSLGWGKTHLAVAVLNWRIDHPEAGPPGKYVNCPDLLGSLRNSIDEGDFEATLGLYREAPLLVLDDLGAEYQRRRPGDEVTWADEQIYRVMDHRYREVLPTVVTTNTALDRVAPRLRDRLRDKAIVDTHGLELPSYRTGEVL